MNAPTTETHIATIAAELSVRHEQVRVTVVLLDDGATMPFIARYRKEATGLLDEVAVQTIRDRMIQLREMDERRDAMLASLEERGLLTDELRNQLLAAPTLARMEDVYLPYRPKRRTRAMIAKERGLEPLAELLWAQGQDLDLSAAAAACVDPDNGVEDQAAALAGARDIIAEWISEDEWSRATARDLFTRRGLLRSQVAKGKEEEGAKFRDYFDAEELAANTPSHRILAVFRGEHAGALSVQLQPEPEEVINTLGGHFVVGAGPASGQVEEALEDGYKRLLGPAMETEARNTLKDRADATAISVFADNMRKLLLAAPLGQKPTLAIDPGFRTGCKVVCLDPQGALVHSETVYLHLAEREAQEAQKLLALVDRFDIEAIAIGNGTAGRETEAVVRKLKLPKALIIVMVNEPGASIYSASAVAREEFPDYDLTVRGAVSIGRRLMDPLAELVKIEPKAIGVGQYQHDVDQNALGQRLNDVVVSCVNSVGVDLNTASPQLLACVSGLGPSLAKSIVQYRDKHGAFTSRDDLLLVPRLGPKAFEQAAGFLRIRDAANPLDASGVHPESYGIVRAMAHDLGCDVAQLMTDEDARTLVDVNDYVTDFVGIPTLDDIMVELAKPGRDPREAFEAFSFSDAVHNLDDLRPGMELPGVVTNVTAFGAFVDVGVHEDGLVHISKLANRFVTDPNDVASVGQRVAVTVLAIDLDRKRVSLSLIGS